MEPRFESDEITRLRPSPWVYALWLVAPVPVVQFVSILLHHPLLVGASAPLFGTSVVALALLAQRANGTRRVERGSLRVDDTGLHWNGRPLLARGRIRGGVLLPTTSDGPVVRFETVGGRVDLGVRTAWLGRELLESVGLDAGRVTASFRGRAPFAGAMPVLGILLVLTLMGALGPFGRAHPLAQYIVPLIAALIAAPILAPSRITVGTDGVLVRWLGTRRFVPYARVRRVETETSCVKLLCHDGATVELPIGPLGDHPQRNRQQSFERQCNERDALAARIRDAMNAAPDAAPALDAGALVRGGRTVTAWLTELRAMAHRTEGGMRVAPVLRDQLLACLQDPHADPEARAGAAAALATSGDPSAREHLRAAARGVASPKLRVVFEEAAEARPDDDAALERVLSRIEGHPRNER